MCQRGEDAVRWNDHDILLNFWKLLNLLTSGEVSGSRARDTPLSEEFSLAQAEYLMLSGAVFTYNLLLNVDKKLSLQVLSLTPFIWTISNCVVLNISLSLLRKHFLDLLWQNKCTVTRFHNVSASGASIRINPKLSRFRHSNSDVKSRSVWPQ